MRNIIYLIEHESLYDYTGLQSIYQYTMQCCISREAREELWIRFSAWIKERCQEEERIINREIGKVLRCIISLLEIRQHYNYQHSAAFLNTPSVINMGEFRLLARGGGRYPYQTSICVCYMNTQPVVQPVIHDIT